MRFYCFCVFLISSRTLPTLHQVSVGSREPGTHTAHANVPKRLIQRFLDFRVRHDENGLLVAAHEHEPLVDARIELRARQP